MKSTMPATTPNLRFIKALAKRYGHKILNAEARQILKEGNQLDASGQYPFFKSYFAKRGN